MPAQQVKVIQNTTADSVTTDANNFLNSKNDSGVPVVKEVISTSLAACPWPPEAIHYVVMLTYIPQ